MDEADNNTFKAIYRRTTRIGWKGNYIGKLDISIYKIYISHVHIYILMLPLILCVSYKNIRITFEMLLLKHSAPQSLS